jgi:hypothetical protein
VQRRYKQCQGMLVYPILSCHRDKAEKEKGKERIWVNKLL